MHTRSVVVTLCATVMGLLVGTIAVGSFTASSTSEGTSVLFRDPSMEPGRESISRFIQQRLDARQASSSSVSSTPVVDEAKIKIACDAVRGALGEMAVVENDTVLDSGLQDVLGAARARIEMTYCPPPVASSSSSASSVAAEAITPTDGNCDRFIVGSARYVYCMLDDGTLNQ